MKEKNVSEGNMAPSAITIALQSIKALTPLISFNRFTSLAKLIPEFLA